MDGRFVLGTDQNLDPDFGNGCQISAVSVLMHIHSIEKCWIQRKECSDRHILLSSTEIMS